MVQEQWLLSFQHAYVNSPLTLLLINVLYEVILTLYKETVLLK